jgi:hypothetical protein
MADSDMLGIVVRADGTLPFDKDVSPQVKRAILRHMKASGHHITPKDGHEHDWHVHSGPMVDHRHGTKPE